MQDSNLHTDDGKLTAIMFKIIAKKWAATAIKLKGDNMKYTLKYLEGGGFEKSTTQKFHKSQTENGYKLRTDVKIGLGDMLLALVQNKRFLQTYYCPYTFEEHTYECVYTGKAVHSIISKSAHKTDLEIINLIGSTECYIKEIEN